MPTSVKIGIKRDGDTVKIQPRGLLSDYVETTVAEGQSVEIYFDSINDGNTYGSGDYGSGIYGQPKAAYKTVENLIDAAGPAAAGANLDGSAWYVDRVRGNAQVDSLLISVEPVNMPEMDGFWGLVTGGDNATTLVNSFAPLTLEATVLARYDEYANRTAVENALKTGVP